MTESHKDFLRRRRPVAISLPPILREVDPDALLWDEPARIDPPAISTRELARDAAEDWALIHIAMITPLAFTADRAFVMELEAAQEGVRCEDEPHGEAVCAFFERLRAESTSYPLRLAAEVTTQRLQTARPLLSNESTADAVLCREVLAALQTTRPEALPAAFTRWTETVTQ